jgi:hypothetical protein
MSLPEHFRFSQNNLQDYVDCPRRFELKYLLKQDWPAVVSEPILEFELHQQLGSRFHTLVQRHLAGIPENLLTDSLADPLLEQWWKNYLDFIKRFQGDQCKAEQTYSIPFEAYRFTAKYDCLVTGSDQPTIIDWKTTRFRTPAQTLRGKMQSMVYPYVLFDSNQQIYSADKIQLIYWFPEFPANPERMIYSQEEHTEIKSQLLAVIQEIEKTKFGNFLLTDNKKLCQFCVYRSLCNRGLRAGTQSEESQVLADEYSRTAQVDFNAIEEIQY